MLAGFSHEALESYIPRIRRHVRAALSAIEGRGEGPVLPDIQRLTLTTILDVTVGLSEGPVLERMLVDYKAIIDGLIALPLPLPGTAYTRAKKALVRATYAA